MFMQKRIFLIILAVNILSCKHSNQVKKTYIWPDAIPPVAEQKPHDTGMHGDTRIDEYYWMADFFSEGPDSEKVVE